MLNLTSRLLALGVLALALPAQPALARDHFHAVYRHHHVDRALAYRHRYAHRYEPRLRDAPDQQNVSSFLPFGQSWGQGMGQYSTDDAIGQQASAQASANGVPAALVQRVIKRESGGDPRAARSGNYGLMQIRLGTARAMGYGGSAAGLLDASTNMTYAVRYLAGAYRAAGGNESRAIALYAHGYNAPRVQAASSYATGSWTDQPSFGARAAASPPFGYSTPRRHLRVAYRVRRHARHHPA